MISDAKVEANRQNAAKSTGPKSPEGKAAACMNAVKHGVLAKVLVLPDEDKAAVDEYRRELLEQLRPVGKLERVLAERIVLLSLRLERTARMEAEILDAGQVEAGFAQFVALNARAPDLGFAFREGADSMGKLARYETTLERAFYRALHELQRLQAVRAGELVPAPVAVDVTVNGGFVSQNLRVPVELPDLL
jgi:hypothetical protein